MNHLIQQIKDNFRQKFGEDYILIQSPGRVNLIGEHTDYNDGFVLPAAIDKTMILAMAPNHTDKFRVYSADMEESFETNIGKDFEKNGQSWVNYILGSVDQLGKSGHEVSGFDCVFGGDIPIGAGLSSSAALEGGVIYGLAQLFDLELSKMEMALMGQRVENDFVGVQCGIMDQFVNIHGKEGHALKLDCRSLEFERYPFRRSDIYIILCDTGIRRELADSEYNIRRSQCEEAVRILQQFSEETEVGSLRDVSHDLLNTYRDKVEPVVYRRCKYVLDENQRVLDACDDLLNDDFESFGNRMYSSHNGLRDLYEVSCRELDTLVSIAEESTGVLGARMMGGGFGGCTINLVEEEAADRFIETIGREYKETIGSEIEMYQASLSGGTKQLP
jgi:galactokinase